MSLACRLALVAMLSFAGTSYSQEDDDVAALEELQPIDQIGVRTSTFGPRIIDLHADPEGVTNQLGRVVLEEEEGVMFIQARLILVAPDAVTDAKLVVKDAADVLVQEIPLGQGPGVREFWTNLVPGNWMEIVVTGTRQSKATQIVVAELYRHQPSPSPLSVVGPDDRVHIVNADAPTKELARSTARLVYASNGKLKTCTTFLIGTAGAWRMLTNQHCISDAGGCASAVVIFKYDTAWPVPAASQRRCARIAATNTLLDYTVFDLDGGPVDDVGAVVLEPRALLANEPALLIQHPGSEPKQVSQKGCVIIEPVATGRGPGTDFTHACDTLGGSSGSPLFSAAGKVVGLHHFGRGGAYPNVNRGVRLDLIASDMKKKGVWP